LGRDVFTGAARPGRCTTRFYLHELRYGFEEGRFCVRIDPFAEALAELEDPEFRITIAGRKK